VLLVMALLLVVTALMAGLVRGYSDVLRFSGGKTHVLEVAQAALSRMASEASAAAVLDTSTSGRLQIQRLDPAVQQSRLPPGGSEQAAGSWQPFAAAHMVTVVYQHDGDDRLIRTAAGQDLELADDIAGLAFTQSADSLLIVVSTMDGRRLRTLSSLVYLPASLAP
jgi:hypothetical protein